MKKRILSIVLAICLVLTLVPTTVFAEGETSSTPSVSAYASKVQLMDDTFAPDEDGYDNNIGKLAFGIKQDGKLQKWYILGKDTGVDGDNTVIFADSSITFGYFDTTNEEYKTDTSLWDDCTYADTTPSKVYPNHYGASAIRDTLKGIASDESRFTSAEQGLMNSTTVTTTDTKNHASYTTTDKLYFLQGAEDDYVIWAGSNNQIPLANESYWNSGNDLWLRTPSDIESRAVIGTVPGDYTIAHGIKDDGTCAQPAANLNLTNVLFSSAAAANPSMDGPSYGTIPSDWAMTLRMDGSAMNIGTVEYDLATDTIKAQKGSISSKVALVVQGKNGEKDWFFSVLVDGEYSINTDIIKAAFGLSSVSFEKCKIWLETVGTDGMIYAVNETKKIPSVEITNIDAPTVNSAFDTSALCATTGVSSTTPAVTWTPEHTTAIYNTIYTASVTLTADDGYKFADTTTATVNGQTATSVTKNDDSTLTVTYKFPAISNSNTDSYPSGEISIGTSSWKTFLNGITFNIFYKNTQTVTITANSNTVNIEYLLSDKELTVAELDKATFTAYNAPFNINPNNEYVIYAKLTNPSGNAIYINSNGIVLDSIAPVISGVKNGKTYCSAQTVTVNEKYIDNVTVNGKTVTLNANNQFTLTAAEGTQKIVATDKAGNVSAKITVTVHDGHIDEDEDSFCDLCKTKIPVDSGEESDDQPEINPDDTKKDTGNKSPQTGNSFNSALWLVLLLSCGGVIIVSGAYSKRKKHSAK